MYLLFSFFPSYTCSVFKRSCRLSIWLHQQKWLTPFNLQKPKPLCHDRPIPKTVCCWPNTQRQYNAYCLKTIHYSARYKHIRVIHSPDTVSATVLPSELPYFFIALIQHGASNIFRDYGHIEMTTMMWFSCSSTSQLCSVGLRSGDCRRYLSLENSQVSLRWFQLCDVVFFFSCWKSTLWWHTVGHKDNWFSSPLVL